MHKVNAYYDKHEGYSKILYKTGTPYFVVGGKVAHCQLYLCIEINAKAKIPEYRKIPKKWKYLLDKIYVSCESITK
jgi:hypothetical protein